MTALRRRTEAAGFAMTHTDAFVEALSDSAVDKLVVALTARQDSRKPKPDPEPSFWDLSVAARPSAKTFWTEDD